MNREDLNVTMARPGEAARVEQLAPQLSVDELRDVASTRAGARQPTAAATNTEPTEQLTAGAQAVATPAIGGFGALNPLTRG